MERSKLAVILVLCIISASAGFLLATLPGLKGPTEYSTIDTWSDKGLPAQVPQPIPTPGSGGVIASESHDSGINTERKIIQRASLSIEVVDFQASSDALFRIVEQSNGFVSDSNSYVTATGHKRGDITIRVPKDKFLSVIRELEQLGTVQSKQISGEDITEEYIDLQARLNNSERQEKRLLEILDKAEEVKDILEVERELERVRGEIEQLTGRITYLENRVELATISVSLYEPEPITQSWGIRDALRSAFLGFVAVIRGLIIAVGYILPLALLIGIGWLLKSKVIPRLRKRAHK